MIPEREQLLRNLFISAENKDYEDNLRKHKLVSPDFIRIILEDAEKDTLESRKELVASICHHYRVNPDNSLILSAKELLIDHSLSVLDDLLLFAVKTVTRREDVHLGRAQIERYSQLFKSVLTYYDAGLKSLKKLTRELARDFHFERFNELRLRFVVRLVKVPRTSRRPSTSLAQSSTASPSTSSTSTGPKAASGSQEIKSSGLSPRPFPSYCASSTPWPRRLGTWSGSKAASRNSSPSRSKRGS